MSKPKKRFRDTKVGKFLINKVPSILGIVGDVLPDAGVLGMVKSLIEKESVEVLPKKDKEIALKLLDQDIAEMQEITKRWEADSRSGWLTANVRPLTLVFFSVNYIVGWYLDYQLEAVSGVLSLIIGAYFGSKGIEKVMGNNRHK